MKQKLVILLVLISFAGLFADGTQPTGLGTEAEPYQIASLDNLLWVSTNDTSWSSHFIQIADIDATDTQNWNSGAGFFPIGNTSLSFGGEYDGAGYTINNLYINRPDTNDIGLFGLINSGEVNNLGIVNADITGDYHVGYLVGISHLYSTISNCYSNGSVNGYGNVGGLVGVNTFFSSISSSYSAGSVSGNYDVGGLVGTNTNSSIITSCYSSSNVIGTYDVGGLVGSNAYSSINNSYSSGSVSGGSSLGGLVGNNTTSANITNCYSTGSVSGSSPVGGLVGYNDFADIYDSFWDIDASGQSFSDGGIGKTIAEMKNVRTFTDITWSAGLSSPWDFVNNPYDDIANVDYCDIDVSINDGYPYLNWPLVPDIPQNVIISISLTEVNINWDPVEGATSYKVYSSDDPYSGFVEDGSGIFIGESWNTPLQNGKKFYYVKAVI